MRAEVTALLNCPFCEIVDRGSVEFVWGSVAVIRDRFPVTEGHRLVIPVRHVFDWFDMSDDERTDTIEALSRLRTLVVTTDPSVSAFNVGINAGEAAGQTIGHAHTHLIPRRRGDTDDPRGGVRGVIPEKQSYTFSS